MRKGRTIKTLIPLVIGLAILSAATVLTVWNERRAGGGSDLRTFIRAALKDVPAEHVPDGVEGQIVRIAGTTSAAGDVLEPVLQRSAPVLRLDRIVETAQWQERQIVTQGGRDLVYELVWSSVRIDSSRFRDAGGAHPNPPLRLQSERLLAPSPKLGAWSADLAIWHAIEATAPWEFPEQLVVDAVGTVRRFGTWWWSGDPEHPAPGDLRLRYLAVPHGDVTMIGRATSRRLAAPVDELGNPLPLAAAGKVPADVILGDAGRTAAIEAWKVRAVALAVFLLGSLILASGFKRLAPEVLGRFGGSVPSLGSLLGLLLWLALSVTTWLLFRLR
ncbi:MAG TPA: TMEM43 family protein [Geminicoccus sp.]|uniref:TMEM43 family protein n=1 Tax=Geminicoccus sp. TaxID=2024832 RepID=UPI002E2F94DC|nr:TMEM43 family protein [Geminicoccus sp.]HEX2527707.1 TMEM43 family protein [Geminicoccus sp.]